MFLQKENILSTSNDCEKTSDKNVESFEEININDSCNSIENEIVTLDKSDTEKKQLMQENISNYVIHLYSLGLPDLVITSILETSNLIFPLIDNIISLSHLDERQNLALDFRYAFENHMTIYKRNTNFVQSIQKVHGIKMKKKYDNTA